MKSRREDYSNNGGAVIASWKSGLTPGGDSYATSIFGLEIKGEAPFSPDFLVLNGEGIGKGLPSTELVMYRKGLEVGLKGAEALESANVPYFNRTWEHFCSHRHMPSEGKTGYPAVTQMGNTICFMHPVFTQYADSAPKWCRDIFLNAVERLLPDPVLKMENAPSALVAAVNVQPEKKRYVAHFLYYVPERRWSSFDVIEDVVLVFNLKANLNVPGDLRKITTVPQGKNIPFRQSGGIKSFTLPELNGHQMVELSW